MESLLEVADQDNEVRFLTQIPLFNADDSLQSKHLEPVKGQSAQLYIRLEVDLNELCEPPRVISVPMLNLYLNVEGILVRLLFVVPTSVDWIGHS